VYFIKVVTSLLIKLTTLFTSCLLSFSLNEITSSKTLISFIDIWLPSFKVTNVFPVKQQAVHVLPSQVEIAITSPSVPTWYVNIPFE